MNVKKLSKENNKLNKKFKEPKIKIIRKKIIIKKVAKKSQPTYKMPNRPVTNVWGDENRFFKIELEKEKKNMFLN